MRRGSIASDYLCAFAANQRGGAAAEYVMLLAILGAAVGMSVMYLSGAIGGGVEDAADLINATGCNNQGLGTGFGGGQGGGGGQGAGSGAGNSC